MPIHYIIHPICEAAAQWALSEVNEFGPRVEPGRGVIHPTLCFESWVPGDLKILIGEGYKMTLYWTESSTRLNWAVGELKDQLEENCGQLATAARQHKYSQEKGT